MHHEFAHILHQQKTFPKKFETLSAGYYDPMYWQERSDNDEDSKAEDKIDHSKYAPLGFVSAYGSSQPREDFVETISHYLVGSDIWWTHLLEEAAKPGINNEPIKGDVVIKEKIEICRTWLKDEWNIDLDSMQANVRRRQLYVDEVLAKGLEEIEKFNNSDNQ
jgi:substrate import-associated zinc metallohydrolase lipoprotein